MAYPHRTAEWYVGAFDFKIVQTPVFRRSLLATRFRAAAPTEGASPSGRRGTKPGDGSEKVARSS